MILDLPLVSPRIETETPLESSVHLVLEAMPVIGVLAHPTSTGEQGSVMKVIVSGTSVTRVGARVTLRRDEFCATLLGSVALNGKSSVTNVSELSTVYCDRVTCALGSFPVNSTKNCTPLGDVTLNPMALFHWVEEYAKSTWKP